MQALVPAADAGVMIDGDELPEHPAAVIEPAPFLGVEIAPAQVPRSTLPHAQAYAHHEADPFNIQQKVGIGMALSCTAARMAMFRRSGLAMEGRAATMIRSGWSPAVRLLIKAVVACGDASDETLPSKRGWSVPQNAVDQFLGALKTARGTFRRWKDGLLRIRPTGHPSVLTFAQLDRWIPMMSETRADEGCCSDLSRTIVE